MNKDDIRKLIGGYASGTLTEQERNLLFEAALDDQELFDSLQQEQALKELLDDPVSRAQIRRAAAESLPVEKMSWFRRPWIWAASASVAAAAVLMVVLIQWDHPRPELKQVAVARSEKPAPEQPAPASVVRDGKPVEDHNGILPRRDEPAARSVTSVAPPVPARALERDERRAVKRKEEAGERPVPAPAPAAAAPPAPSELAKSAEPKTPQKDNFVLTPPPAAPVQAEQSQGVIRQQAFAPQQAQQPPAGPPPQSQTQITDALAGHGQTTAPAPAAGTQDKARTRSAKTLGAGGSPPFAMQGAQNYSIAKRLENGTYANIPLTAAFAPGDIIRVTVVTRVTGDIELSEWDSTNSSWKRVYPAERETVQVRAGDRYTVPLDIVVKPGERLRVEVGGSSSLIPLVVR